MIRAAAELFHRQGLGATNPDDIVNAAGADRRRFYHYFKNKQGIAHEVLRCYVTAIETRKAPINYEVQSWQDLSDWFFAQLELQRGFKMTRTCPFGTIATGVTENDERIRQDLDEIFGLVGGKLAAFFSGEKSGPPLPADSGEIALADFCIAAAQGATLIGKITWDSNRVEAALRMALARAEACSRELLAPAPQAARAVEAKATVSEKPNSLFEGQSRRPGPDAGDTRLRMIETAADLFHRQGVGATSPNQIIESSGVGKGQFYYFFKSKEGIVHEVLLHYLAEINANASPINYQIDSWDDLERWFRAHIDLQQRFRMTRGCPLGTIANELTENDVLVRQDLSLIFETIRNKLAAFFIREKARGQLSSSVNEDDLANFCIAAVQGAMLLGKVKRNARVVEAVVGHTLAHIRREFVVSPRDSVGTP
jgi:TetR/AcrR family transcriptional regulator, transcriptional repressor for nem operon